ncbi:DoxX family protein [Rhodopirellula europaea]|uniref:DoxX family protein n=1 Tax=Rhodopirellula europaea TaxID=1263866 RepID=UPI003D2B85F0|tara:strand:- start:12849 stop:13268 length:420 start_codon:yes stop_codon:yes gene_type:complete
MNTNKKLTIAGWILSGLLALMLIGASASAKLTAWEGKSEMFAKMGWSEDVMFWIGIVEVTVTVLFLIPRTSFIGAILLAAYLGGATATHVRMEEPFFIPIIVGIVAWIALGLRNPAVFRLAFAPPSILNSAAPVERSEA